MLVGRVIDVSLIHPSSCMRCSILHGAALVRDLVTARKIPYLRRTAYALHARTG